MREPIYEIKGVKLDELEREYGLQIWFYNMVQKSIEELTLGDVGRMLRQDVFLDIAIPLAWKYMLADPFDAEMYEGELIVAMTGVVKKYPDMKNFDLYERFVKKVQEQIEKYDWGCEENKVAYKKEFEEFCAVMETR